MESCGLPGILETTERVRGPWTGLSGPPAPKNRIQAPKAKKDWYLVTPDRLRVELSGLLVEQSVPALQGQ